MFLLKFVTYNQLYKLVYIQLFINKLLHFHFCHYKLNILSGVRIHLGKTFHMITYNIIGDT